MHVAALLGIERGGTGAGRSGDIHAHVDIGGFALAYVVRVLHRDLFPVVALMAADHQQLLGDERGGQSIVVTPGVGRAIAGGVDHQHVGMFAAQPEEEFLQQLLVAAHGNSRAQQRIHRLAFHIHRANAVDAPTPVEDARAVLHQIHRGRDVGRDAGVRVALDDHLEARPGTVQCTEKSLVAGIAGVGGEDAGDAAAVIVRPVCVAGVEAGALLLWIAGSEVLGKMRCIEVHRTLDDADTHRLFFAGALAGGNAFAVVVHRIEEAVGGPLPVLRALLILGLAGFLLVVLGGRFLDHHGIHAYLAAQAQHHGVALGQIFHW